MLYDYIIQHCTSNVNGTFVLFVVWACTGVCWRRWACTGLCWRRRACTGVGGCVHGVGGLVYMVYGRRRACTWCMGVGGLVHGVWA